MSVDGKIISVAQVDVTIQVYLCFLNAAEDMKQGLSQ